MKQIFLPLAALLIVNLQAHSQIERIRHSDKPVNGSRTTNLNINPGTIKFDQVDKVAGAPNISISMEPKDGDYLVYHPTPGFSSSDEKKAQISVKAYIHNKETKNMNLDKVVLEYKKGGNTITKIIQLSPDQLVEAGYVRTWQNSRDYHAEGDIIYLVQPFPTEIKAKFYFKNNTIPVVVTKKLKAFDMGFALPFKASDLGKDEYWSSYSMHGGGGQVFAYDMTVSAYKDGAWTSNLPGTDGTQNDDRRVWGKPIYAMADGIVIHSLNTCPNNPKPGEEADWDDFEYGGAGNHLYIKHGNYVALYAHMQKGTVTNKFLTKGAVVKKGDKLGIAGNAGSSSGPHLHVHLYTYKNDDEPEGGVYRPLLFNTGYVIGKDQYTKPMSNVNWSHLDKEGITGLEGKASFIWPSDKHVYCAYGSDHTEVSKHGVSSEDFQEEFDKIQTCGYYPVWMDGYDVNGKTYYNMVFRPSAGVAWYARAGMDGNSYQDEYDKWGKAGYNLLFVDSYLSGGQVRYSAVWKKDSRQTMAYHGQTNAYHNANFKKNMDAGWVPVNVSTISAGGSLYVTALWEKKNTGGFYHHPAMTLAEYKTFFAQYSDKEKFKLVYLNAFVQNGKPMLSGIWYKTVPNFSTWWAKHHLTASGYQTEFTNYLNQGYLTRVVTGYEDGNVAHFEGIWSK